MKLYYFQGDPPNFGDELNVTMWSHLLPRGFLDGDESELFLGIGSIIQHDLPPTARKIVVGSGYGGYTEKPDPQDGTWDFRFVRGPQTAEELGLPPERAIADAAVMLRATPLPAPAEGIGAAFIPHYESLERGNWADACAAAGVHLIDPTGPTERVIAEIRGARVVIAEAMHGAIVADALRTPWVAVRTMDHVHRFKWFDWARALDIDYRPEFLWPSHMREGWAYWTGRSGLGPRARAVFGNPVARPANAAMTALAARSLVRLAGAAPVLSPDAAIGRATERALEAVDLLVRERSTGSDRRRSVRA